jgi:hypothetical protein
MVDELSRPGRRTAPNRGGDDAPPAVLRLHHSADLIEAVPYLIGFQPRDSVVLVGIEGGPGDIADSGGRVRITVRMDIADLSAPSSNSPAYPGGGGAYGATDEDSAVDDGAHRAAVAIHRSGATAVVGVVFVDSEPGAVRADEAANQAGRACKQVGLELGDLVVVAAPGLTGAAPEGADRVTSRVAAEATYAGLVALQDRGDLVELLAPEPAIDRVRLCPALKAEERVVGGDDADGRRRRRSAIRALFAATRTLAVVDEGHLIRFGAALSTIEVRDACWLAVEAGRMDGEDLWRELSRRLPAPYDAAPLFLFGWQRWRNGDGVLAGIAARRALDSDAGYTAADLLHLAVTDGLDPFRTPRLRKGA